jgi:hypothetical protein
MTKARTLADNYAADINQVTADAPLTGGGTSGTVTVGIQAGTTAQSGAVQLTDSTASTSITTAATPNSVKSAYDLANGAIAKTIVDAKADLITATAADIPARLAVGANNTVLTADSSTATGLKWATPASAIPGFSLITTLTLAGNSSYTVTGLDSYNQIYCALATVSADANNLITYRFNSDTSSNYAYQHTDMYQNGNSFSTANVYAAGVGSSGTGTNYIGTQGSNDDHYLEGYIHYMGTKSTGPKLGYQWFMYNSGTHSNYCGPVQYLGSSSISEMTFTSTGTLDNGVIRIYGSAV